jgi:hypothetical protein
MTEPADIPTLQQALPPSYGRVSLARKQEIEAARTRS